MDTDIFATDILATGTNAEDNPKRKHRFLPLLLAIGAVASAILSAGTAIYTTEELLQIKTQTTIINSHMASFTDTVNEQHDQLVMITKDTDSL